MDQKICIKVQSLNKKEYVQAGAESLYRVILPLFVLVTVVVMIIAFAIDDFSMKSLIPPYVLVLVGILIYRFLISHSWKNFPADTAFSYEIDSEGWQLTLGEQTVAVKWMCTVRLTVRSHVVLLYNEDNRSNLIPRRCLTKQQLDQLRAWFKATRKDFKQWEKAKEDKYRKEYRKARAEERYNRRRRGRGNHL